MFVVVLVLTSTLDTTTTLTEEHENSWKSKDLTRCTPHSVLPQLSPRSTKVRGNRKALPGNPHAQYYHNSHRGVRRYVEIERPHKVPHVSHRSLHLCPHVPRGKLRIPYSSVPHDSTGESGSSIRRIVAPGPNWCVHKRSVTTSDLQVPVPNPSNRRDPGERNRTSVMEEHHRYTHGETRVPVSHRDTQDYIGEEDSCGDCT